MIFQFLSHLIFSTILLQIFPVDAADIQRLALFPSQNQPVSSYTAFTLPTAHLPESPDASPVKINPASLGVVTSASSAIVVDRKTKRILFEKNIDAPRSIGSITKLMTALVFLKTNPDLNAPASLESTDYRAGGVQHISLQTQTTIKDILYASLISSDNSATASVARLSGLSADDFVVKMNEMAASLGMSHSTFVDPTGLSPKNESVVTDLVKLFDAAANNEIIRDATERSTYTVTDGAGKTHDIKSTDQLLSSFINQVPYHVIAGKTGYLPEAGYCLGSVMRHDAAGDVIIVVLGSDTDADRFQDLKSLVVWTYNTFKW